MIERVKSSDLLPCVANSYSFYSSLATIYLTYFWPIFIIKKQKKAGHLFYLNKWTNYLLVLRSWIEGEGVISKMVSRNEKLKFQNSCRAYINYWSIHILNKCLRNLFSFMALSLHLSILSSSLRSRSVSKVCCLLDCSLRAAVSKATLKHIK